MKIKSVVILIAFSLTACYCKSQNVPLGQWTDYLSYQKALTVCEGRGIIYCCCPSGVFSYNTSDNSLQRYSKVSGLSDIGCTVARYNPYTNTLVIGYTNGNIDLMQNGQVTNIPDLKNSPALGDKAINNIYFSNDTAYVSCGQGVMLMDLSQDIIIGLCYIGNFGSAVNVYSTTTFNDTIFAATDKGIYKAAVNDPDLLNYNDWHIVTQHLPVGIYNSIVTCGNRMYAGFSSRLTYPNGSEYNKDTLFVYNSGIWSHATFLQATDNIYSLESSTVDNLPCLIHCGNGIVHVYTPSGNDTLALYAYSSGKSPSPGTDALVDNYKAFWVADPNYGLEYAPGNYSGQSYIPPGPYSNTLFDMSVLGSNVYIAPGGYAPNDEVPQGISGIGVSEYSNGSWYRLIDNAATDTLYDICSIAIDPKNPLHAYAGSYDNGVIEYNNNAIVNVFNPSNSSLTNLCTCTPGYSPGYYSVRVGGVGIDSNGNLWADNSVVESTYLSVKKTDGTWQSFDFGSIPNLPEDVNVTKLLVTKTGAKWILFPGSGILAYQDNGTFAAPSTSNSVFMNNAANNGGLPSLNIYCATEDLNGSIWVGTDQRIVVFYSPDGIFNGPGGWDAQNVYVQQTGYTQYLMQGQYTTCIAIDGGNRKWIGTQGGGAFLMSADGTQQILNFTSSNSPLLSNNILSIGINQETGEVFFGTDEGVVSYRGDATGGNASFGNVYAYPDPVPHGYSGPIAIKNLVTNSDIKITNVSGELVYHTVALGGQAVWYGNNFSGERVQTGVYMVFCTSPDGKQSLVTKLLLVN